MDKSKKKYLKVGAAAEHLGISANTLRKYTDLGLIKAKRSPFGDRSYDVDVLEEYWRNLRDGVDSDRGSSYTPKPSDLSLTPRKEDQWE